MNVLVVNLTRFGDLLQSAATVRALAKKDGGGNAIGVICLENFVSGAELLPETDAIFPLPSGKIMAALNAPSDSSPEWLGGVRELHAWLAEIKNRFRPDAVYNISPTTSSCLLGRLLAEDKEFSGFTIDSFGYRHNANAWAAFMQGATAARSVSPFNIVDLFRKIAGDAERAPNASLAPLPEEVIRNVTETLRLRQPEGTKGFVALQLGASAAVRQWPVASFAAVGDALWKKRRLLPILVGAKAEMPLGEEYAKHAKGKYISCIGGTDIPELGAVLCASSLLISNDTGTLHLGSGLGVPVIGIYLATAQAWDTGPYADGNHSLEPDIPCHPCEFGSVCEYGLACHKAIAPETVITLAERVLDSGTEKFAASKETPGGARVWQSAHDAHGFADLVSLSGHENAECTQWMRLQRLVYRQFFDNPPDADFVFTKPAEPVRLTGETALALAAGCDAALASFDALLQQAAMLAENPVPLIKDRFQRTLQRLSSILAENSEFSAIAFLWRDEIMTRQSLEDSIPVMARYRDLFKAIRSLL